MYTRPVYKDEGWLGVHPPPYTTTKKIIPNTCVMYTHQEIIPKKL